MTFALNVGFPGFARVNWSVLFSDEGAKKSLNLTIPLSVHPPYIQYKMQFSVKKESFFSALCTLATSESTDTWQQHYESVIVPLEMD